MPKYEIEIKEVKQQEGPGCGTAIVVLIVLYLLGQMLSK